MVGPAAKREGVAHLQAAMGLSERRACSIVGADRKMVRYRSRRPPDTELRDTAARARQRAPALRLSAAVHPAAAGGRAVRDQPHLPALSRGRPDRAQASGAAARRGTRAPILVEARPNARWSLDFVHDQFANGRRFRILNIVDDVTRECLAAIPDTSISGRRVARELTALIERRGKPGMIVSDNGTEFTSNAMLAWAQDNRIAWHFIAPGKPMQNGFCESFNGRMRDELLNESLFFGLDHARTKIAAWVADYNQPAAALGAGLPHAGGLRRQPHRNGRSAAQPRPAPPIACCSTRATRRKIRRGSNRRWMKIQWQVTRTRGTVPELRSETSIRFLEPAARGVICSKTANSSWRRCGSLFLSLRPRTWAATNPQKCCRRFEFRHRFGVGSTRWRS